MPDSSAPQPADLTRQKAALRAKLAKRRADLPAAQHAVAGERVAAHLLDLATLPRTAVIAGYWPLAAELDPRPAMARLAAAGHPLALPRLDGTDRPLVFHAWRVGETLVPGPFRLLQPSAAAPRLGPEVVLVPLLGFDRHGRRLGWGKGYYDRTLRALRQARPTLLAIGLGHAIQEVEQVPAGAHDETLDLVVTERGVHAVRAGTPAARPAP